MKPITSIVTLVLVLVAAAAGAQVDRVVATLKLPPGAKVADIGSGRGRYSVPLASAVGPNGVVYAIDINADALKEAERAATAAGVRNVVAVVASADDPRVPEPVDLVFFSDSLHHIGNQAAYLKNLRTALKPGGRIAVIDFVRNWPNVHHIHRYTVEELDGWMKSAGLARVESHDFVTDRFFALYR
jgi:ubiquinone/menaquinone biosynthesis C-methylase UbiE